MRATSPATAAAPSSAAERQQQGRCYCVVPNSSADGRYGGQATATGRRFVERHGGSQSETTSKGIFDGLSYDSPSPLRFAENPQAVLEGQRQRERWWRQPILPGVAVAAAAVRAIIFRINLPDGQTATVHLKDNMTDEEFLASTDSIPPSTLSE